MDKVSICHECGRTIDSEFHYCPWCGVAMDIEEPLSAQFDAVFSEIETISASMTRSRISRIENKLGELENDLSLFLAGTPH